MWSRSVINQVERLRDGRAAALASAAKVKAERFYGHEDAWAFYALEADKHFAMTAARQLLRALQTFDGKDRLPDGLSPSDLRTVRDALEHWDEADGRANRQMRNLGADPASHQWRSSGPGVIAGMIDDTLLVEWATSVYAEVVAWDPW